MSRIATVVTAVFLLGAGRFSFVCSGVASWFYPAAAYGRARVCAMNAVPVGTEVRVVNNANGRESNCRVIGTWFFVPGRVIDVSASVATALDITGLASVRVYRAVKAK